MTCETKPTQATARPWRVGPFLGHVQDEIGRLVANCRGYESNVRPNTAEENEGNARVIVRAVNRDHLFDKAREALRNAEERLTTLHPTWIDDHDLTTVILAARAVLAEMDKED